MTLLLLARLTLDKHFVESVALIFSAHFGADIGREGATLCSRGPVLHAKRKTEVRVIWVSPTEAELLKKLNGIAKNF